MSNAGKEPVIIAAVEGGGTSFKVVVCEVLQDAGLGSRLRPPKILHRAEVDSSHDEPLRTLDTCSQFLRKHKPEGGYHALGLATFGPVGVHRERPNEYGQILPTTPKAAWRGVNVLKPLTEACEGTRPLAINVETDVNAPALAEFQQIGDDAVSSCAYVTVGTGVGVGLIVNGKTVHGRMHPEGGHIPIQPLPGDSFPGYSWGDRSPFRGKNTVEGVASSVALTERLEQLLGEKNLSRSILVDLPDDHEVWDHAANAVASLCATLLLTLSIERIVLGGGIIQRQGLLEKIRSRTVSLLNGYLELPGDMSELITLSSFGKDSGLIGAMALAQDALFRDEDKVKAREKKMKQEAFGHGLWHGFIVGGVGAALIAKYAFSRTSKR